MSERNTHNRNFGKRNPRMARVGNESARKSPPWLDRYDLDTFRGVDDFTKELLRLTWTGDLGTRQSADCLSILRLLLERRLWLPMSSERFNPEVRRYDTPSPEGGDAVEEAQQLLEHLTEDEQAELSRLSKELEKLATIAQERATAKDPVKAFKDGKNASSRMSGAVTGAVRNVIKLIRSDDRSPTEKVRTLEEFKAKLSQTADSNGSGDMLESGLALLNREIERLKGEGQS